MAESKIQVYDNVLSNHDAQMVSDIMTDKEFLWHYYHRSDKNQEIYHWHRLAGRTDKEVTDRGFEWIIPSCINTNLRMCMVLILIAGFISMHTHLD